MSITELGHYGLDMAVPLDRDWRPELDGLVEALRTHCQRARLEPTASPELPNAVELAEARGPVRVVVFYDMFPIIGYEQEGETALGDPIWKHDADGELMPIIGDPCWRLRADTLARRIL